MNGEQSCEILRNNEFLFDDAQLKTDLSASGYNFKHIPSDRFEKIIRRVQQNRLKQQRLSVWCVEPNGSSMPDIAYEDSKGKRIVKTKSSTVKIYNNINLTDVDNLHSSSRLIHKQADFSQNIETQSDLVIGNSNVRIMTDSQIENVIENAVKEVLGERLGDARSKTDSDSDDKANIYDSHTEIRAVWKKYTPGSRIGVQKHSERDGSPKEGTEQTENQRKQNEQTYSISTELDLDSAEFEVPLNFPTGRSGELSLTATSGRSIQSNNSNHKDTDIESEFNEDILVRHSPAHLTLLGSGNGDEYKVNHHKERNQKNYENMRVEHEISEQFEIIRKSSGRSARNSNAPHEGKNVDSANVQDNKAQKEDERVRKNVGEYFDNHQKESERLEVQNDEVDQVEEIIPEGKTAQKKSHSNRADNKITAFKTIDFEKILKMKIQESKTKLILRNHNYKMSTDDDTELIDKQAITEKQDKFAPHHHNLNESPIEETIQSNSDDENIILSIPSNSSARTPERFNMSDDDSCDVPINKSSRLCSGSSRRVMIKSAKSEKILISARLELKNLADNAAGRKQSQSKENCEPILPQTSHRSNKEPPTTAKQLLVAIFSKVTIFQQNIIATIDAVRRSLSMLLAPNSDSERRRRECNVQEFARRFARNYLYQINRMTEEIRVFEFDAKAKDSNLDFYIKVCGLCGLLEQALNTYHKQLKYFICDQVPKKLNVLIEYIGNATAVCVEKKVFSGNDEIIQELIQKCREMLEHLDTLKNQSKLQIPRTARKSQRNLTPNKGRLTTKASKLSMYDKKSRNKNSTDRTTARMRSKSREKLEVPSNGVYKTASQVTMKNQINVEKQAELANTGQNSKQLVKSTKKQKKIKSNGNKEAINKSIGRNIKLSLQNVDDVLHKLNSYVNNNNLDLNGASDLCLNLNKIKSKGRVANDIANPISRVQLEDLTNTEKNFQIQENYEAFINSSSLPATISKNNNDKKNKNNNYCNSNEIKPWSEEKQQQQRKIKNDSTKKENETAIITTTIADILPQSVEQPAVDERILSEKKHNDVMRKFSTEANEITNTGTAVTTPNTHMGTFDTERTVMQEECKEKRIEKTQTNKCHDSSMRISANEQCHSAYDSAIVKTGRKPKKKRVSKDKTGNSKMKPTVVAVEFQTIEQNSEAKVEKDMQNKNEEKQLLYESNIQYTIIKRKDDDPVTQYQMLDLNETASELNIVLDSESNPPASKIELEPIQEILAETNRTQTVKELTREANNEKQVATSVDVDGLLAHRMQFIKAISENPLYANENFSKPWQIVTGISDRLLDELTQSVGNDIKFGEPEFIERFLRSENQFYEEVLVEPTG